MGGTLTLGEHIESIISKDYPPPARHQYHSFETQAWKLRRALQQKELDQAQAQSREKSEERNIVRIVGPPSPTLRPRYYPEPPVPLSPLDYVKNRIAEVMRTSEEDGGTKSGGGSGGGGGESPGGGDMVIDEGEDQGSPAPPPPTPAPFITTSATYTYPFSALSLNTGTTAVPVSVQSSVTAKQTTTTDTIPEPAPLLSTQYETLSDEED